MKTNLKVALLLLFLPLGVHAQDFIEIGVGRHFVNGKKVSQKEIKPVIYSNGGMESRRLYT